ncbi:MAG: hypothetical protein JWP57_4246, partial [Spirosoma sp.]|nr:hypothetical protein [Spirosoma sp.]
VFAFPTAVVMNTFRYIGLEFFRILGLRGPGDLLDSLLGLKMYKWQEFKIQAAAAAIIAFLSQWIWHPPYALAILMALDIFNAIYGTLVAVKIKGDKFKWDEAHRTFGKLFATFLTCALLRGAIVSYPFYEPTAHVLFGWLFSRKMAKLTQKMAALKVQESGLPNLIKAGFKVFLQSKYGELLVDAAQKEKPNAQPPEEPTPPSAG